MILFIGTEERGYFVEDTAHSEVEFSGYAPDLSEIMDSVILARNYSHIIIDAEMLINDYVTIGELPSALCPLSPPPSFS